MTHSKVFCSQYISYLHDYSLAFPSIISLSTLVNKHLSGISSNCLCLSCHNYKVWCQCDVHIHVCECVCVCVFVVCVCCCVPSVVLVRLFDYIAILSCVYWFKLWVSLHFRLIELQWWQQISSKSDLPRSEMLSRGGEGVLCKKMTREGGETKFWRSRGGPLRGGIENFQI